MANEHVGYLQGIATIWPNVQSIHFIHQGIAVNAKALGGFGLIPMTFLQSF